MPCSCIRAIYWSQMLRGERRCSWSSADRRCSNYIWVVNKFNPKYGASYIRDLTVLLVMWSAHAYLPMSSFTEVLGKTKDSMFVFGRINLWIQFKNIYTNLVISDFLWSCYLAFKVTRYLESLNMRSKLPPRNKHTKSMGVTLNTMVQTDPLLTQNCKTSFNSTSNKLQIEMRPKLKPAIWCISF